MNLGGFEYVLLLCVHKAFCCLLFHVSIGNLSIWK